METQRWRLFVILVAVATIGGSISVCNAAGPYKFLKEIPVGGEGGWDCLNVDTTAHRLYVPHSSKVVVIDTKTDKVVGEIADTPGVHDFVVATGVGRGFSSNGREDKVSIVDLKTLKTIEKVDTGKNPDGMLYDPATKQVYAFNGRGDSATVIDAKTGKVVATVKLPGKPEFSAVDTKAGKIYVNIENKSEVAVIDTGTHKVTTTWPITPGEEASGMGFDPTNHRLFLACGGNHMIVMMDCTNGKVLGHVPISGRTDGAAFDPATHLAFASCGDGTVTIAREETPDKLVTVQTLKTERGARTMTLDPTTHKIYLPSAKFEPQPTPAPGHRRHWPRIVPGSFKVLVYGMEPAKGKK